MWHGNHALSPFFLHCYRHSQLREASFWGNPVDVPKLKQMTLCAWLVVRRQLALMHRIACMQEARGEGSSTPQSNKQAPDAHMLETFDSLEEDEDFPSLY